MTEGRLIDSVYEMVACEMERCGEKASVIKGELENSNALHFLVTWAAFESKLLGRYFRIRYLRSYVDQLKGPFPVELEEIAQRFHERYKPIKEGEDNPNYRGLVYDAERSDRYECVKEILNREYSDLYAREKFFLVIFVVYRYRNNLFHGNKRYGIWYKYKCQINDCIRVMLYFIENCQPYDRLIQSAE